MLAVKSFKVRVCAGNQSLYALQYLLIIVRLCLVVGASSHASGSSVSSASCQASSASCQAGVALDASGGASDALDASGASDAVDASGGASDASGGALDASGGASDALDASCPMSVRLLKARNCDISKPISMIEFRMCSFFGLWPAQGSYTLSDERVELSDE